MTFMDNLVSEWYDIRISATKVWRDFLREFGAESLVNAAHESIFHEMNFIVFLDMIDYLLQQKYIFSGLECLEFSLKSIIIA